RLQAPSFPNPLERCLLANGSMRTLSIPSAEHASPFRPRFLTRRNIRDRSPESELVAHLHHFAVAEVDFDEFRPANRFPVLVLERGDDFPRARVDDIGRMTQCVTSVVDER